MQFMRRFPSALGALAAAGLLAGCATPIGIRTEDPRAVQRYLTRSALTDDKPSDFSQIELRRYDLLAVFEKEPDLALEKLHAAAKATDFPRNALFALAELSFLRAAQTKSQLGYASTVVYSYALLFPEKERAPLPDLDPRSRIAADLYNRALTSAFVRTRSGTIEPGRSGEFALPLGRVTLTVPLGTFQMNGSELYDLLPVTELEIHGLRNRYRRPGIGAPLAAKTRPLPGVVQVIPVPAVMRVPLTAVVRIETPLEGLRTGDLRARLELFASLDTDFVEIDGRQVPLESEPSASLAASLAEAQFWKREIQVFLGNAIGLRQDTALVGIRPYKPGRIPVVFVHGTASSSARWADMINDLLAGWRLRDRYSFWFFTYDSGNPIAYSGSQLRAALSQAVARADPTGQDPCVNDMVVMGHSQGGLLTKLTVIDSSDTFWKGISDKPFEDVKLDPEDKLLLQSALFMKPLPFVKEVIFLATPQQGSYLAGPQFVRRLAEYFVRLPSEVVRVGAGVTTYAVGGPSEVSLGRMPTSIDNMSPGNRFIKALASIPVSEGVTAHSIIAIDGDAPLDQAGDGVVKYQSAHIEPIASELIVKSPHSGMQAAPATVEEVRRILVAHSLRSNCPMPKWSGLEGNDSF
ncbi:MAG: esterase/lipase family protein [Candidatus Limnocylindria bacterium]|jgi:pimeloyl-ACP methyl ester carboxylesterase